MPTSTPPGAPGAATPRPARRPVKIILITLVVLLLAGLAGVFVWVANRYQQGIELAKKAREEYGALNARYPFQPPAAAQAPASAPTPAPPKNDRWAAAWRVREAAQAKVSPRLRQTLQGLLGVRSLTDPAVYRALASGIPLLQPPLAAQLEALGREQMSAREYQWRLGLALVRAMENPARSPVGAGYWEVLKQLQRVTHADGEPGNDVEAKAVYEFFRKAYGSAAAPPQAPEALGAPDAAACALDLLMVAAQWAAPDAQNPEGILRRLLPKR